MDKRYKGLSFMQGKLYVPSSTREVYGRLIRLDKEVKVHEDISPYTTVIINPSKEKQIITPSKPFIAFGEVIVNPISDEYIIPEGELTVTENCTYNVTDKANVIVNTPIPSGTLEITENGEYDVSKYSRVIVRTSPVYKEPSRISVTKVTKVSTINQPSDKRITVTKQEG